MASRDLHEETIYFYLYRAHKNSLARISRKEEKKKKIIRLQALEQN